MAHKTFLFKAGNACSFELKILKNNLLWSFAQNKTNNNNNNGINSANLIKNNYKQTNFFVYMFNSAYSAKIYKENKPCKIEFDIIDERDSKEHSNKEFHTYNLLTNNDTIHLSGSNGTYLSFQKSNFVNIDGLNFQNIDNDGDNISTSIIHHDSIYPYDA